jgi:magnesium chelatase subunit I
MVGSGNPEEGDLRPQLLDRFGLSVDVRTPGAVAERIDVIRRRDAYDRDPGAFMDQWKTEDAKVLRRIQQARKRVDSVVIDDEMLGRATALCVALGTDGLRGELTLMRASRATAALDGARKVTLEHLRQVAPLALRHRLRRNPLDDTSSTSRVERAVAEVLAA